MNLKRWLAIVAVFFGAFMMTITADGCGNGGPVRPSWVPKDAIFYRGAWRAFIGDKVTICPPGSGQSVLICQAEFNVNPYTIGENNPKNDVCLFVLYSVSCQQDRAIALSRMNQLARPIMLASGTATGGYALDCWYANTTRFVMDDYSVLDESAPPRYPQSVDGGKDLDGGQDDTTPTPWPPGPDDPGQLSEGECTDHAGEDGWEIVNNPNLDAGAMCTPSDNASSCSSCAAEKCCKTKTACAADSTPGKPGSCGCWKACEQAGFTLEQCGEAVDPTGPHSCGAMDAQVTNYEACLNVECTGCGLDAVAPIGQRFGMIGRAEATPEP